MVDPSVCISDERFTFCVSTAFCGLHFCSTVYTLCGVSAERCAFCAPCWHGVSLRAFPMDGSYFRRNFRLTVHTFCMELTLSVGFPTNGSYFG